MLTQTEILNSIPVDELTGSISVPVYQTSTFVQERPGINKGFDYSRSNNPTRKALEDLIAKLENGKQGFAFSSGLAAVDAVLKLLKNGDEIIAVDDIYGGTYRLLENIYSNFGLNVKYVNTTDIASIKNSISARTACIWLESPTNPTLKISDIKEISNLARENNIFTVVDNTFATPVGQNPLSLGADIVIHSATKYLAGHSDVIAGLVVAKNEEICTKLKYVQNSSGAVLGPQDCWLTIRGIETLKLRFEKQSENALKIAIALESNPNIDRVHYPGLASNEGYATAIKQQSIHGGIISFTLKHDCFEAAEDIVSETKLFKLAESLGGVKSLICHPYQMTHKSTPPEIKEKAGIKKSLIRLSVGIEEANDLLGDIETAINKVVIEEGVLS